MYDVLVSFSSQRSADNDVRACVFIYKLYNRMWIASIYIHTQCKKYFFFVFFLSSLLYCVSFLMILFYLFLYT